MEVRDFGGESDDRETANPAGLGTSIIQAMCRKLNAHYACFADDKGTRCQIHGVVLS